MTAVAFDTLDFATKLKEAGMSPILADVQAQQTAKLLKELSDHQLATKDDFYLLREDAKHELNMLRNDMMTLKSELMKEIHANTLKIIGLLAGLQALFHFIK